MLFPHAQEVILLKRKNMLFCLLASLCLLLTGCGSTNTAGGGKDGSFHIVTSFYPMYVATINITQGVDGVTVQHDEAADGLPARLPAHDRGHEDT